MTQRKILVGICGHASGGKDTAAAYLVSKYGFTHISTGDIIRDYIATHKLGTPNRNTDNKIATMLRTQLGNDYFAKEALKNPAPKKVVSGLRNKQEVITLKNDGGIIIHVDATIKLRYERAKLRGRIGDNISFAEFVRQQKKEEKPANPSAPNVAAAIAYADFHVTNNADLKSLYAQIDDIMRQCKVKSTSA